MVSQLLSPTQPKNISDVVVVAILGFHLLLLYLLPHPLRISVFAVIYIAWRLSYNAGIGWLLYLQSNHKRLVHWAKRFKLFENPSTGNQPHPTLYKFIKLELETKIPKDYKFEEAPIEYNTWLIFRRVVDLILMCDFISYCCFAAACGGTPPGEKVSMTVFRWVIGWLLIGFNLWVKLDAHRVVKDYAWYWGDFFYLIDQELTFDGVFEMAPHPMYSVGYVGYYGISILAASYYVLFISIFAHAAQFAFLVWVESPHIEKTYNPPPPRDRTEPSSPPSDASNSPVSPVAGHVNEFPPLATTEQPSPVHNLLGMDNIDFARITDSSVLLLQMHLLVLTIATPDTYFWRVVSVLNAIAWRTWFTIGLGFILNRQSAKKSWTRHFVKHGESTEEGWRQWKGLYYLSTAMTYSSFVAATYKHYQPPTDWTSGYVALNHTIGIALVALHLWTSVSIYQSLGEFGWFFGDFFFDNRRQLTYSGIYRFLNNPERVIGLAGLWAAVLFTSSPLMFFTALVSHVLSLLFIQFVERPHMQKMYGRSLRSDSGFVKGLKRSLPPTVQHWQGSVDRMFGGTVTFVDDFIETARPRIAAGVRTIVKDTSSLFTHPSRITITRLEPDMAGYDSKDYSLEVLGNAPKDGPMTFRYGEPIRVKWTAPLNHSKWDWIGLYRVTDNDSREVTKVSSVGRWVTTNRDLWDFTTAEVGCLKSDERVSGAKRQDGETQDFLSGVAEFAGDKLWWTTGTFEFRYHHNSKHNVMAISRPFGIRILKFDEDDVETDANGFVRGAVEKSLLPLVRNCLDRDPDIAPNTVVERYGAAVERDGKYARRVVYAVARMYVIGLFPSAYY
jgi:phosphatidylethanolamine N-methyltransferase